LGIVAVIIGVVIVAVFFVIANAFSPPEIVGTWGSSDDKYTFNSDGTFSTGGSGAAPEEGTYTLTSWQGHPTIKFVYSAGGTYNQLVNDIQGGSADTGTSMAYYEIDGSTLKLDTGMAPGAPNWNDYPRLPDGS
jgi:hypothetical protein